MTKKRLQVVALTLCLLGLTRHFGSLGGYLIAAFVLVVLWVWEDVA